MSTIFGISKNPVSTIGTTLTRFEVPAPEVRILSTHKRINNLTDKFVSTEKSPEANAIIKKRNGIGKLMSHFSKPKPQK